MRLVNTENFLTRKKVLKMTSNFSGIRWFSELNPWMDCIVIVQKEDAEKAMFVMKKAIDKIWDEEGPYETYGDIIEKNFFDSGIDIHWSLFYDADQEDDKYSDIWEKLVETIQKSIPITIVE